MQSWRLSQIYLCENKMANFGITYLREWVCCFVHGLWKHWLPFLRYPACKTSAFNSIGSIFFSKEGFTINFVEAAKIISFFRIRLFTNNPIAEFVNCKKNKSSSLWFGSTGGRESTIVLQTVAHHCWCPSFSFWNIPFFFCGISILDQMFSVFFLPKRNRKSWDFIFTRAAVVSFPNPLALHFLREAENGSRIKLLPYTNFYLEVYATE